MKTGNIRGAHIFPTVKAISKYFERHQAVFKYLVEKYGYEISVETACENFAKDMDSIPEKEKKEMPGIKKLIEEINASGGPENTDIDDLKGVATVKEMKHEAVHRLIRLGVMEDPVVERFISEGKLYMSEFGGILYDLDQPAEEAVKRTKEEFSCLPYAVLKSVHEIGTLYTVLFVTEEKSSWKYERPDKNGLCDAYVYNANDPILSEEGNVCVQ